MKKKINKKPRYNFDLSIHLTEDKLFDPIIRIEYLFDPSITTYRQSFITKEMNSLEATFDNFV